MQGRTIKLWITYLDLILVLILVSLGCSEEPVILEDLQQIERLVSSNQISDASSKLNLIDQQGLDNENKAFLRYQFARISYKEKNYSNTMSICDVIIQNHPGTAKAASAKYLKGYAVLKSGNRSAARIYFKSFIDEHPQHHAAPDASLRYAFLTYTEPDVSLKEKKTAFENVVQLCPDSAESYEARKSLAAIAWFESEEQKTLDRKSRVTQMYDDLEKDAQTDSDRGYAAMQKAALALETERTLADTKEEYKINYNLVIAMCDRALDMTPESDKKTRATADLIKSECIYYSQSKQEALNSFKTLLGKYSQEKDCQTPCSFAEYMIAMIYMKCEDYDNAQEHFKKILTDYKSATNYKHNNIQALSYFWLANIASKNGQTDLAKQYLNQLNTEYPESLEAKMRFFALER